MINPQKGIDLMNNTSIINRILFAVTIFQHSPLTRRVFYNNIRRERGHHHLGTLTGVSINHQKFFHHQNHHFQQRVGMVSSSASTWISIKLIHHHHITRLVTSSQHEAGHIITTRGWYIITARGWHIITARGWHIITTIKLTHHHNN
jgi:hypothetical protein